MNRIVIVRGKQKEMLQKFISHNGKSQLAAAKALGVPRRSLRNWMEEERTLPEDIFKKIVRGCPSSANFTEHICNVLDANWGRAKGGKKCYMVLQKKYGENEFVRRRLAGGKASIKLRLETIVNNLPPPNDKCVLELLGALMGDGWIGISGGRKQVCFCGNLHQHSYANHLQKLMLQAFRVRGYLKFRDKFSVFYIIINSGPIFDFFYENFDFPVGPKNKFNINLLPSDFDKAVHVIRGIFDTDGGIYFDKSAGYARPYPTIDITSHNPELLSWLYETLAKKGFKVIRLKYSIRLKTYKQVERWFNEVKPSNEVHTRKWNHWKSNWARKRKRMLSREAQLG